jgi:hypothetical protein
MRPLGQWYLRDGTITTDMRVWGEKFQDPAYKRVAETTLPDGKWVSTVWVGMDHSFGDEGPPLIFETMVFPTALTLGDLDCERYSTEAEALAGHEAMVAKWRAGPQTTLAGREAAHPQGDHK